MNRSPAARLAIVALVLPLTSNLVLEFVVIVTVLGVGVVGVVIVVVLGVVIVGVLGVVIVGVLGVVIVVGVM
jgi:hypothetical protein